MFFFTPSANISSQKLKLMIMMMMVMMMMMMNCFCGLISNWDHCQRSSKLWISDTPRVGFEPAQNLNSGLVEWNYAVELTTKPERLDSLSLLHFVEKRDLGKRVS